MQHFGSTRRSNDPNNRYDLLYPLLDLTTSLDPRFNVPYQFGAIFLAEAPPGGPGSTGPGDRAARERPEGAARRVGVRPGHRIRALLVAAGLPRGGCVVRSRRGVPRRSDLDGAARRHDAGGRRPPRLLAPVLAAGRAVGRCRRLVSPARPHGGCSSSMPWIRSTNCNGWPRRYEQRAGRQATGWDDLRRAGYMREAPIDPTGAPYQLQSGR